MTLSPPDAAPHRSSRDGTSDRPYQSLYRRYRPQRFEEVRGQEHITRALRNAVRDDRVAHAYLFSGPRGTGKTSTARILAKALNCSQPVDGEPCGHCESCVSIVAGTSFDVHELDAASNNGVEAMRDLVARSALASPGRWKVYIVDEVHMLSTAASNALLKTLEEPPDHVAFVLATTDPQKVLPTIRSRTQHFEFHLLGDDVLEGLLEDVASDARLELPEGGLGAAIRRGRGSARDALSMLDQVAASGTVEDDPDSLASIVAGLAERDTAMVLVALDEALQSGRDPQQVAVALVERLRAGFLMLVAPGIATSGAQPAGLTKQQAVALGAARCVRAMELVGASIVAMREAPEPRITFEVALVRCAHPEADDTVESLLDRLVTLERRLESLEAAVPVPSTSLARGAAPNPPPAAPPAAGGAAPAAGGAAGSPPSGVDATSAAEVAPPTGVDAAPSAEVAPPGGPGSASAGRPAIGAYLRRPGVAETRTHPAPSPEVARAASPPTDGAVVQRQDAPPRDDLVAAWGDHVLTGLRPKVRAYFQAGRFVGAEGSDAVFALPNAVHVAQAEPLRSEVVDALGAHFGRAVGLRLVVEGTWSPPATTAPTSVDLGHSEAPTADRPGEAVTARAVGQEHDSSEATGATREEYPSSRARPRARAASLRAPVPAAPDTEPAEAAFPDEEDETDEGVPVGEPEDGRSAAPGTGLAWAEDRLLQAFPGAEEV